MLALSFAPLDRAFSVRRVPDLLPHLYLGDITQIWGKSFLNSNIPLFGIFRKQNIYASHKKKATLSNYMLKLYK